LVEPLALIIKRSTFMVDRSLFMERSTFIVDRRGRHRSTVKVDRSIA